MKTKGDSISLIYNFNSHRTETHRLTYLSVLVFTNELVELRKNVVSDAHLTNLSCCIFFSSNCGCQNKYDHVNKIMCVLEVQIEGLHL